MDFSTITNINLYSTIQAYKAKGKPGFGTDTKTPQATEQQFSPIPGTPLRGQDDALSAIITKMQSGQDLSPGELDYLREKAPDVYDKAVAQARERAEYKEELRRCKTKEDVRILHLAKIAPIFAKAKDAAARNDLTTVQSAGAEAAVLAAIFEKFTATKEYASKAENHLELEKSREHERKQITEKKKKPDIPENQSVDENTVNETEKAVQSDDGAEKPEHKEKPPAIEDSTETPPQSSDTSGDKAAKAYTETKQMSEHGKTAKVSASFSAVV